MNYFWMFGRSLFLFTGFRSPVTFCQATPRLPSNWLRHVSRLGLTLPMYKHAVRPLHGGSGEKRAVQTPESRRIKGYKMFRRAATSCLNVGFERASELRLAGAPGAPGGGYGPEQPLRIHGVGVQPRAGG